MTVDFANNTYDLAGEAMGDRASGSSGDFPVVADGTRIRLTGAQLVTREGQYPDDINGINKSNIDHQRVEGRRERLDAEALTAAMEVFLANAPQFAGHYDVSPVEGRIYGPGVAVIRDENGEWSFNDVTEYRRGGDDLLTTSIQPHNEAWVTPSVANLVVGDGASESVDIRSGNLFTDNGERFLSSVEVHGENGIFAESNGVYLLKFHTD